MNDEPNRFADIDLATWRARVEKAGTSVAALTHAGLDGVAIEALYDHGPARAVVVPPRTRERWACLQQLPREAVRARAVIERFAGAQIDGVWIAGDEAQAIVAMIPSDLSIFVQGAGPRGGVAAWAFDPCAPSGVAIDAAVAAVGHRPVRTWLCDGTAWHDAGATARDEIAIVLAGVLGALRVLGDRGIAPADAAGSLLMRVGLGGDVLVDIAKLRALRGLWHACATQLGIATSAVPLHARTARRTRSRLDADTNLVRATYELFAAATTGVDAVVVEPHAESPGPDADRWARNLAHLMRHESHLDAVDDPFAGSWAIESLTRALADAAWARVQEIERGGGLAATVAGGSLQRDTVAAAARRVAAVAAGTHPLVGVSKFAPPGRPPAPAVVEPELPDAFAFLDLCRPYEGGAR